MNLRFRKSTLRLLPWLISTLLAACYAAAGLLFIFQHIVSFLPALVITFITVIVLSLIIHLIIRRYIWARLVRLPYWAYLSLLGISLVGGVILVIRAPPGILSDSIAKLDLQNPYVRRLLVREETLLVTVTGGERNVKSNGEAVELLYMTTDFGDVSFQAFEFEGQWENRSNSLFTDGISPASLTWLGQPGRSAQLVFISGPNAGIVSMSIGNQTQVVDLYAPSETEQVVDLDFPIRPNSLMQVLFISAFSLAASFLLLSLWLSLPVSDHNPATQQVIVSVFFLLYLVIGAWVYQDFGIPTDENTQRRHGLVSAKFIIHLFDPDYESSLFEGLPDLQTYKSKNYGVALNLPLALFEVFTDFSDIRDMYLFRHYVIFLFFFLGTIAFFKTAGEKFADWRIGLLGAAFFIMTPRIFADSFFNVKDTTFLAAFTIAMYFGFRFWRKPGIVNGIWFGFTAAFATNVRIITVMLVALVVVYALIHRERPIRSAWSGYLALLASFASFLVLLWPASWTNPVKIVGETLLVFSDFERFTGTTLFRGITIPGHDVPPEYLPVWIAITTPTLYLFGFLSGCGAAVMHGVKSLRLRRNPIIHEDLVFLSLAVVPVLAVIVLGSTLYNGWRHFFFIYAPILMVALIGLVDLWRTINKLSNSLMRQVASLLLAMWVGGTLFFNARWMIVNHPHQNVYYNPILVQAFGGREAFDRDYWGLSIRQGLEYVLSIDDRNVIKVQIDGNAQTRGFILEKADRDRIMYIEDPQTQIDYYIGIYSVHNKRYPYDPTYSILVDGLPILTIYTNPELD